MLGEFLWLTYIPCNAKKTLSNILQTIVKCLDIYDIVPIFVFIVDEF